MTQKSQMSQKSQIDLSLIREGTQMNELDILVIHDHILHLFEKQEETLNKLRDQRDTLRTQLMRPTLSNSIRTQLMTHEQDLQRQVEQLEQKDEYHFYLLEATPLITSYKEELSQPIRMNFMGDLIPPDTSYRDEIQHQYLHLAQRFIPNPLSIPVRTESRSQCEACGGTDFDPIDKNMVACQSCGSEKKWYQMTFSYRDVDRINMTTRYTYDRRIHFRDQLNQFQGKQNNTILPHVYEKLREQLELNHLIDHHATTLEEQMRHVTKRHIYMFLKECGLSKHYEDINLIHHKLTGTPLNDVSHLEEKLMQDFDALSELYDEQYIKSKKINRKNFINTQYVLFQLLRRHKYPCEMSDFNFLKTTERKCFHDTICSELFRQLGWNHTNCF
jgi:rubredoxin